MGSYNCRLAKNEAKVLFQGLDAAGKTTILYHLVLGEVVTAIPTIGFNVEKISTNLLSLHAFDVGSRDKSRPLHRHHFPQSKAVIYVIDSSDRDRLTEASSYLKSLLEESELGTVPFLILANKQDLDTAMTVEEVKQGIGYEQLTSKYSYRKVNLFGCSAVTKEGQENLIRAFDWLAEEVAPPVAWYDWLPLFKGDKSHDTGYSETISSRHENDITPLNKDTKPWSLSGVVKRTASNLKWKFNSLL